MSNAVFPTLPGLAWGVKKTPVWSTNTIKSANGRELRAAYYRYPLWRFTLSFEVLRTRSAVNELERLAGFFNARRGSFESFLYEDPTDNSVSVQSIGFVQQGRQRYPLIRSFGGFVEPVAAVRGDVLITVGGVPKEKGRDYVIDGGDVVFQTPLTAGQKIEWSGGFYFRVRFAADTADFENFIGHLWKAKKIELVSVR